MADIRGPMTDPKSPRRKLLARGGISIYEKFECCLVRGARIVQGADSLQGSGDLMQSVRSVSAFVIDLRRM